MLSLRLREEKFTKRRVEQSISEADRANSGEDALPKDVLTRVDLLGASGRLRSSVASSGNNNNNLINRHSIAGRVLGL